MSRIVISLTSLPSELAPTPGKARRQWWNDDWRTRGHAENCLPLLMANRLGYVVHSPGTFRVRWNGDWEAEPAIEVLDASRVEVDAHSAGGTFTVQPGFVATTTNIDDFLMVRPLTNNREAWFAAMDALIEAWWQAAEFGIVCLLHRRGSFVVERGDPIAQMCVYPAVGGAAALEVREGVPAETEAWRVRRYRPGYRKDLDYFRGVHPDGRTESTHRTSWRSAD